MTATPMTFLPAGQTTGLSNDVRSLEDLKTRASKDPKGAVQAAAKQFEALFMQELVKSMRKATLSSGMLDNEATKMGTEMLDGQIATQLSGMPGGLSEAISRQLQARMVGTADAAPSRTSAWRAPAPGAGAAIMTDRGAWAARFEDSSTKVNAVQANFVVDHLKAAQMAEQRTGIPAAYMVAQAGHESGWGRSEIRHADGKPSYNLFGIKAGSNWQGKTATVTTTEYIQGEPRKVQAKFRAYSSYAEAFEDYARLLAGNPRYSQAVNAAQSQSAQGFALGLQKGGYATDPAYASKLGRAINTTMRLQRMLG